MQETIKIMQTVTLTIAGHIDRNYYTYKPYIFKYNLPTIYEQNQKLNTLIHNEIKRLSWEHILVYLNLYKNV